MRYGTEVLGPFGLDQTVIVSPPDDLRDRFATGFETDRFAVPLVGVYGDAECGRDFLPAFAASDEPNDVDLALGKHPHRACHLIDRAPV